MSKNTTRSILRDTYASLQSGGVPDPRVERFATGEELVFVSFDTDRRHSLDGVAHAAESGYSNITEERASTVVERALDDDASLGDRALGVATLNALSAGRIDWESGDPMEQLVESGTTVGMVGLFAPALSKFSHVDIQVIERFPEDFAPPAELPPGVTIDIHGPENAVAAFEGAEVVFVTGSTLVYGGLRIYLDAAPDEATLVALGATSSFVPGRLFDAGFDLVGGVEVSDPSTVGEHVERGTPVADLHGNGLQKRIVSRKADEG